MAVVGANPQRDTAQEGQQQERQWQFVRRPWYEISAARATLSGPNDDQGVIMNGVANITPTEFNALAFSRTTVQVLNVVDLGEPSANFGFFPQELEPGHRLEQRRPDWTSRADVARSNIKIDRADRLRSARKRSSRATA